MATGSIIHIEFFVLLLFVIGNCMALDCNNSTDCQKDGSLYCCKDKVCQYASSYCGLQSCSLDSQCSLYNSPFCCIQNGCFSGSFCQKNCTVKADCALADVSTYCCKEQVCKYTSESCNSTTCSFDKDCETASSPVYCCRRGYCKFTSSACSSPYSTGCSNDSDCYSSSYSAYCCRNNSCSYSSTVCASPSVKSCTADSDCASSGYSTYCCSNNKCAYNSSTCNSISVITCKTDGNCALINSLALGVFLVSCCKSNICKFGNEDCSGNTITGVLVSAIIACAIALGLLAWEIVKLVTLCSQGPAPTPGNRADIYRYDGPVNANSPKYTQPPAPTTNTQPPPKKEEPKPETKVKPPKPKKEKKKEAEKGHSVEHPVKIEVIKRNPKTEPHPVEPTPAKKEEVKNPNTDPLNDDNLKIEPGGVDKIEKL